MLYELQKSLTDRFESAAGATLRAMVQGLWEDVAPGNVVLGTQTGEELERSVRPFIVFSIISTGLEQDFCSNFYSPLVQFSIFGDGDNKTSLTLLQIGGELLDLYEGKLLPMDNDYTMISSMITGLRKVKDEDNMWQIIYDLDLIVQKAVTRERVT